MPRIVVQAEFQAGQAIKDATNYAAQLKAIHAGLPNLGAAPAGSGAAAAAAAGIKAQGQAAQKVTGDFERLNAELKLARSTVATIGLENMSSKGLTQARTEMERIRAEALKLRDSGLPVEQAAKYAGVVSQATAALDKLAAAQRGAAAKAGAKIINFDETKKGEQAVRDLDRALTQLEANRRNGQGNFQAYRAELKRIQDEAFRLSSNADITGAARAGNAKVSVRAANMGSTAEVREAQKYADAVAKVTRLLSENKVTADVAQRALSALAARTSQLADAQGVGADAARRYGQVTTAALKEVEKLKTAGSRSFIQDVRELDNTMRILEANRKNGVGTLQTYAQILERIRREAGQKVNDPTLSPAARAAFAGASGRAGGLLAASETAEVKKLTNAVSVLKALLAENKITADQAATGFDNLARRASTAASTLGVSADAAAKFSRALLQAKREAEAARSGGAAVDPGVAAAQAGRDKLRELNDERRSGLITSDRYRAAVTALGAAMKAEAQNTANSTAAKRAYTKATAEAADALKREAAERTQNSTGGSLPFSLNSVAFQGGALATGAGAVIGQGLKLNEELVQARLTLESTAKFYKASLADVRNEVKETAVELRQDEATVAQATANLLRKSFSPEMAAETIKRFSDAGTAAGLDATNAIIAASQALLSEQSRQLNSAGIAENLGPELTKMNAAIRAGKEFIGPGNPYRKFYDELRAGGKSVAEATKAVALFQFVMKATDPIAGRTEQSLNSLTGALNNFKVQRDKGLKAIVEGISGVAIPALNTFTSFLAYFNNELPTSTKNAIGFSVAFTAVGLATAAVGATLLSFGIQQARVLATLPDFIAGNARLAAAQRVLNTQLNIGTISMLRHSLATRAAGVSAIFAAGGWVGLAAAIRAAGVAAVTAMPYLLPLTVIAAATAALNNYFAETVKIYDEIEKMEKENYDARVARDGKEITQAIDKIVLLQGVLGQMRERVDNATTPQEERDALKAVAFTEARIEAERKLIREIRAKREAENGAAQATDAQAEAYRNLLVQLDGVAARFGDMKLTTFQKELKDVSKEQERLLKEIVKGEKEFETSERQSGLTPEQAAKLRKGVADLLPNATRSLVQRELDQYQRDAVDAELETQKARAELLKDGVAQRQVLLKAETAKVKQEYADRIRVVQANQQVDGLTNGQRLSFGVEIERLTAEQADKIKLLEEQAARDLVDIRKERAKKLLDVEKVRLEAELSLLGQVNTALDAERERVLRGTDSGNLEGRLAVEQQFAARSVELAERTADLQAQIRRRELNAELAENLAAAAELGEGRAAAEAGARAAYRLKEQAAALESENALNAARVAAEERVQEARAAIVNRWVEDRLRGIDRLEGAELASLMRTLAATERAYRARGEFESADKVADALKRTQEEAQDRAEKVRSALLDGQKEVDGFNRKLDELTGKATKGIQGARLSAQNPFTTYADSIMEERRKLLELQAKLVNPDAKLQGAITARLRVLEAQERQVRGQGQVAANRAAEAFTAAERDKAVRAAAKRAADLYDGGEGDARAYRAALRVERTYWSTRLQALEEGSSEYESAQARIEELDRTTLDLNAADARRPVEDARAALELLDAQSALARTDAERLAFLQRRLNLLREVAALEARRATDPTLKPSDRQAAQVAALRARAEAEAGGRTITEEQRAALESLSRLRDAQVDYALATARSEGQVTAALKEQVVLAERAVQLQDEEVARLVREGAGQRQVTDATAERYRLEVTALEKRRALNRRGFDVDRDVLDLLEAQAKARLALAGIDDDGQVALATARIKIGLLREELAVQGQLALVGADRRSKEKELANALTGLAQAEEQANEKLRERVRLEREVADARRRLAFTASGLDLDEPSALREQLAQNRVNQERLLLDAAASNDPNESAKGQKELLDLQVEQLTLTRQLEEAERKRQDGLRGARDALAALVDEQRGGSEQSRAELAATRELTSAREALTRAQVEYGRAQAELLRQPTTSSTDRFRAATEALTGAVKRQRDALSGVAGVYTKLAQDMKGVTDSAAKLRGETGLKEEFDGNREIDRFYAIQRRRDRQIRELQDALRRGDVAAITAASTALADQEKSYREQAELLKKNGVNVNLSNTRVVEDLARQVDDLGIQYDREDAALTERARIASQEAQAADTFAAAVQELGQHTQELLTGIVTLPAPAARETQAAVPAEAGSAPLGQAQLRELVAGIVAGIDEARAERLQATTPTQPSGTATTQPQVVTTNNYDTKVYVDGQRFPTVPGVNELVQAVIPPLEAYFADKFRRSGRDC